MSALRRLRVLIADRARRLSAPPGADQPPGLGAEAGVMRCDDCGTTERLLYPPDAPMQRCFWCMEVRRFTAWADHARNMGLSSGAVLGVHDADENAPTDPGHRV